MSEDNINYEEVNKVNLNILDSLRNEFWKKVWEDKSLHSIKVEILDSECPKCTKFIDSEAKICKHCNCEFSDKTVKIFKKSNCSGKGKKLCSGCNFYVAVRTYICDCGWDFKNKVQTTAKVIEEKLNNIKKKKSEFFEISKINDLELLIKNDRINNNYLKIVKEISLDILKYNNDYTDIKSLSDQIIHKRNQLINFNKKLVLNYVNIFHPKSGCKFLKKEDLISTGNFALIKAINHFDINKMIVDPNDKDKEKNASFSTYAIWWIKKEIINEINEKEKDIRIPSYIILIYKNFVNYYNEFKKNNNEPPSLEDVMRDKGLKEKKARGLLFAKEYRSSIGMNIEDINTYSDSEVESKKGHANLRFNNGSLDTFRLTDTINEENFELSKIDWSKIKFKNDRYKQLFFNLKGLEGYTEISHTDAAEIYDITPATIKKIEKDTIEKIRKQLKIQIKE